MIILYLRRIVFLYEIQRPIINTNTIDDTIMVTIKTSLTSLPILIFSSIKSEYKLIVRCLSLTRKCFPGRKGPLHKLFWLQVSVPNVISKVAVIIFASLEDSSKTLDLGISMALNSVMQPSLEFASDQNLFSSRSSLLKSFRAPLDCLHSCFCTSF